MLVDELASGWWKCRSSAENSPERGFTASHKNARQGGKASKAIQCPLLLTSVKKRCAGEWPFVLAIEGVVEKAMPNGEKAGDVYESWWLMADGWRR